MLSPSLSLASFIKAAWRCEKGTVVVDVTVPANTIALVTLPDKTERMELGSGEYHYEYATRTRLEQDHYTMEIPLRTMLEHPAAVPLIRQYMPGMLDNPMIQYVMNEPISAMLAYAQEAKPLYEMILKAMNDAEE